MTSKTFTRSELEQYIQINRNQLKTQVLDKIDELNKKGCDVYDSGKDKMYGFWKEDYDKFIKEIKEIFENGK